MHESGGVLVIPAPRKIETTSPPADSKDTLLISIPSQFIGNIPANLATKINQTIVTSLNISHTTPDILSILRKSSYIQMYKTEQSTQLLIGNADKNTLNDLKQLVQTNDQYNYPKKHAFALPDKTIAFEYVPGKSVTEWETYNGNCSLYEGKDSTILICQKGNNLVVTTSKENISSTIDATDGKKWLIIDKNSQLNINASGNMINFTATIAK